MLSTWSKIFHWNFLHFREIILFIFSFEHLFHPVFRTAKSARQGQTSVYWSATHWDYQLSIRGCKTQIKVYFFRWIYFWTFKLPTEIKGTRILWLRQRNKPVINTDLVMSFFRYSMSGVLPDGSAFGSVFGGVLGSAYRKLLFWYSIADYRFSRMHRYILHIRYWQVSEIL